MIKLSRCCRMLVLVRCDTAWSFRNVVTQSFKMWDLRLSHDNLKYCCLNILIFRFMILWYDLLSWSLAMHWNWDYVQTYVQIAEYAVHALLFDTPRWFLQHIFFASWLTVTGLSKYTAVPVLCTFLYAATNSSRAKLYVKLLLLFFVLICTSSDSPPCTRSNHPIPGHD